MLQNNILESVCLVTPFQYKFVLCNRYFVGVFIENRLKNSLKT